MTQRHQSDHKYLPEQTQGLTNKRFASTLPAQTLAWLSSVSLLSSGFAFAQTESSIDNVVPTIKTSQPQVVLKQRVKKNNPSFAERRARLKKRLNRKKVSSSAKPTKKSRPTVIIRTSQPKVKRSQVKKVNTPVKSAPGKRTRVAQPARKPRYTPSAKIRKRKDYNNAYIDPTRYKSSVRGKYQPPTRVIVKQRYSNCQLIFSKKEIAAGACRKKAPATQRVAKKYQQKTSPSWIKKSQTASLKKAVTARRVATKSNPKNQTLLKTVATVVNNNRTWRSRKNTRTRYTKTAYRPHRFIPKPSEFSSKTTVNTANISRSFRTLPPPMAQGNIAPRPSNVSYDFALASVLPQISYSGAVAYRGGMNNVKNAHGMIFPLSVPAPITSLFGWRIHPITGNRRFHAGTDIGAPTGTPIVAAAKGQVQTANWRGGYGLTVTINHTSAQQTLYGHMSEILVRPGQWVEPGTVIGLVGSTGNSTGPHLHFEVRHLTRNGWVAVDPGVRRLQASPKNIAQSRRTTKVQ